MGTYDRQQAEIMAQNARAASAARAVDTAARSKDSYNAHMDLIWESKKKNLWQNKYSDPAISPEQQSPYSAHGDSQGVGSASAVVASTPMFPKVDQWFLENFPPHKARRVGFGFGIIFGFVTISYSYERWPQANGIIWTAGVVAFLLGFIILPLIIAMVKLTIIAIALAVVSFVGYVGLQVIQQPAAQQRLPVGSSVEPKTSPAIQGGDGTASTSSASRRPALISPK